MEVENQSLCRTSVESSPYTATQQGWIRYSDDEPRHFQEIKTAFATSLVLTALPDSADTPTSLFYQPWKTHQALYEWFTNATAASRHSSPPSRGSLQLLICPTHDMFMIFSTRIGSLRASQPKHGYGSTAFRKSQWLYRETKPYPVTLAYDMDIPGWMGHSSAKYFSSTASTIAVVLPESIRHLKSLVQGLNSDLLEALETPIRIPALLSHPLAFSLLFTDLAISDMDNGSKSQTQIDGILKTISYQYQDLPSSTSSDSDDLSMLASDAVAAYVDITEDITAIQCMSRSLEQLNKETRLFDDCAFPTTSDNTESRYAINYWTSCLKAKLTTIETQRASWLDNASTALQSIQTAAERKSQQSNQILAKLSWQETTSVTGAALITMIFLPVALKAV